MFVILSGTSRLFLISAWQPTRRKFLNNIFRKRQKLSPQGLATQAAGDGLDRGAATQSGLRTGGQDHPPERRGITPPEATQRLHFGA